MRVSYYTIDDVRLGHDRKGVSGWRLSRFLRLRDALEHYRELPASGVKALGLTDGIHTLELVKCLPLFPDDREGESILASDYRQFPLWADCLEAERAAACCVRALGLRYGMGGEMIVPLPKDKLPRGLLDKYLSPARPGDCASAIRRIYVAGTGWVSPGFLNRRASPPLVLKYQADGITEQGACLALEVEPWEYELLALRTEKRLNKERRCEQ